MNLPYLFVGLISLPFIAVPLLIWFTQKFSAEVSLRLMEESFIPIKVRSIFESFLVTFTPTGFEYFFDAMSKEETLGFRFYHRVLFNKLEKTWGVCVAICDEEGEFQKQYFEFRTRFSTEASFTTHNCNLMDTPIRTQKKKALSLPSNISAEKIYEIHKFYIGTTEKRVADIPTKDNALENFKEFLFEENEELLSLGAIYFDGGENVYRPTIAGAVLIGWYNMWPFTFLRKILSNFRLKLLMQKLASTTPSI